MIELTGIIGRAYRMEDSSGRHSGKKGLTTEAALDFILDGVESKPANGVLNHGKDSAVMVMCNLWQNVEWILKDLEEEALYDLLKYTNVLKWRNYELRWNKKYFMVEDRPARKRIMHNEKGRVAFEKRPRRVEVIAVDAVLEQKPETICDKWRTKTVADAFERYVEAAERVEVKPIHFRSKGSLGGVLLKLHLDRKHYRTDDELTKEGWAIEEAYFGARIQTFKTGEIGDVWAHDINSAYPAAMLELPSLKGAKLRHVKRYQPDREHAIWKIKWDTNKEVGPFPVRSKLSRPILTRQGLDWEEYGQVAYPLEGKGLYHAVEVAAAIRNGYDVEVLGGWVLDVKNPEKPFAWVKAVYEERKLLESSDPDGAKVLKWAMQGLYGKMAQIYNASFSKRGNQVIESHPVNQWQSRFWAGEVTARTRATILDLSQHETPVYIATDCVYFAKEQKKLKKSNELGGLKKEHYTSFWIAKPNLWRALQNGKELFKASGNLPELDWERLKGSAVYGWYETAFVDIWTALRGDFSQWRKRTRELRTIRLDEPERFEALGELS